MSIKTIIKDDKLRFLASGVGEKAIQPTIDAANDDIVAEAKRTVHVISGATRDSIHREGNSVVAGEGAVFEELGTRFHAPHPFLRPAFAKVSKALPERIGRAYKRAIGGG